ncbi:fasciclin domain-containing protein [Deinococcus wulumuqiensis]
MKKRLGLMTLSLLLVSPAVAGGAGQPAAKPATCKSIAAIVASDPQFSTLATALEAADLTGALAGSGSYTLFAPTNAAFAKVPSDQLAGLLGEPEQLSAVLSYHVVAEKASAAELRGASSGTTEQGADVQIKVSGSQIMINDARVVKADIQACNGVVHAIDAVLMPPTEVEAPEAQAPAPAPAAPAPAPAAPAASTAPAAIDVRSIPALPLSGAVTVSTPATTETGTTETSTETATEETATEETATEEAGTEEGTAVVESNTLYDVLVADERFSTLRDLLSDADLTDMLMSGEYTVFAPTDEAFAALPEGALAAVASNPELLLSLLRYHVVQGRLTSEQVQVGSLQTVAGSPLTIEAELSPAIESSTGLIYPVDAVLLPEGFTVPEVADDTAMVETTEFQTSTAASVSVALEGESFSVLRGLLTRAGLTDTLASGEYTIFAPTDEAFAALPAGTLDALTDEQVKSLLTYHVVPGRLTLEQVEGDTEIKTVQGTALVLGNAIPQSSVTAGTSTIYVVNGVLFPNDFVAPDLSAPATSTTTTTVTTTTTTSAATTSAAAPAQATPGTAQGGAIAGGTMTSPPANVAAVLQEDRFSTVRELLTQAGLLDTLGSGAYTVFLPTNDAFGKLDAAKLNAVKADAALLKQVLTYHVVSGQLDSAGLTAAPLTTVEGSPLAVTSDASGLSFDGMGMALDGGTPVTAGTTTVYVLDSVLLPPSLR